MDKLIKWLENSFAPKLQKITNLTWVVVIKDSVMQLLPFILPLCPASGLPSAGR